jgi:hydrogenase maturation protease
MMEDIDPFSDRPRLDRVRVDDGELRPGDHVRLRPLGRADILDMALAGKTATIESIQQDLEDRIYLAVLVDDDPGRDLGLLLQPGHRFFFGLDEVEPIQPGGDLGDSREEGRLEGPIPPSEARPSTGKATRVLVACVGNIFLGDDAFGVEVARRLADRPLPEGVRVVDFGIRGCDLTFALLDDYEAVILVDAAPRGGPPGTLYVIEPDLHPGDDPRAMVPLAELHDLDPAKVLRLSRSMGGKVGRVLLVGCEPLRSPSDEDFSMEMSEPVKAAVDEAVLLVESLVNEILQGTVPGSR